MESEDLPTSDTNAYINGINGNTVTIKETETLINNYAAITLEVENTAEPISTIKNVSSEHMDIDEIYDKFSHSTTFSEATKVVELSRRSWQTDKNKQQYTRGSLWSPDGTCILTAVNLDGMHVMELPSDLYNNEAISTSRSLDCLTSAVHVKEGGTIYDYAWYPFMNSSLPESCCWLASRQHEPIHMWDAFTGKLRCTYRGYDAADEIEPAIAVTFSLDGQSVIGGYKKTLKIFQTNVPGREYTEISTKNPVSSFALHSAYPDTLITGSWNSTIKLFDIRMAHLGALSILKGHTGGVTNLKFSNDGTLLYSGARKDNKICQWDLRDFTKPLAVLQRNVRTNQKIYFDFNSAGQLASGDTEGLLRVWNIEDDLKEFQYFLHHDCCNGISFHPGRPIFSTTSGQYHFFEDKSDYTGEQEENININYENSIVFWWYGKCENLDKDELN